MARLKITESLKPSEMKSKKPKRNGQYRLARLAVLPLCIFLFAKPSKAENPSTDTTINGRPSCPDAEFNFRRITPRTFILSVKSIRESFFEIGFNELDSSNGDSGKSFAKSFRQWASPAGEKVDVFFEDLAPIISRGGYVKVHYHSLQSDCDSSVHKFKLVRVFDVNVLQFDGGRVYSLEHDGSWHNSAEYGIRASSQWNSWIDGFADIRYASLGRIDTSGHGLDSLNSLVKNQGMGTQQFQNPFDSRGGVFRTNLSLQFHIPRPERSWPSNWTPLASLSVILGGGATSNPGDVLNQLHPRYFIGFGMNVEDYSIGGVSDNASTSGFVHFLLVKDKLWRWDETQPSIDTSLPPTVVPKHEFGRFVVEGQLEIPGLGGKNIKPALEGYIDTPISSVNVFDTFWKVHDGANPVSVVSISVLLHFDLTALKAIVGRE